LNKKFPFDYSKMKDFIQQNIYTVIYTEHF